ncbi:hypothetical protein LINPERHAP2_LOCUS7193 [Linum perenne]
MVLRNFHGDLLSYRSIAWNGTWWPVEAECRIRMEALSWVEQEGHLQVIFETDAKQIVDALSSGHSNHTELGDMIVACRAILLRNSGLEITFGKREKNKVAHLIARRAILHDSPFVGNEIPIWFASSLAELCTEIHE